MRLAIKQLAPAKASSHPHPHPRSPFDIDAAEEPLPAPSAEAARASHDPCVACGRTACERATLREQTLMFADVARGHSHCLRTCERGEACASAWDAAEGSPAADAAVGGLARRTAPCPWLVSLPGRVTLRAAEMLQGPRALAAAPLHRPLASHGRDGLFQTRSLRGHAAGRAVPGRVSVIIGLS